MPTSHKQQRSAQWQARLARLAAAAAGTGGEAPDAAARLDLLRRRAQELARPLPTAPDAAGPDLEVLAFVTGGERHAFPTEYVTRVLAPGPITPLPGLPPHVVGIMAAGGDVLSVVDLRTLLHIPVAKLAEPAAVIVLCDAQNEFGVLADEITGFERHAREAIQPPETGAPGGNSFLLGITGGRTGILDAARLLHDPRLTIDAG